MIYFLGNFHNIPAAWHLHAMVFLNERIGRESALNYYNSVPIYEGQSKADAWVTKIGYDLVGAHLHNLCLAGATFSILGIDEQIQKYNAIIANHMDEEGFVKDKKYRDYYMTDIAYLLVNSYYQEGPEQVVTKIENLAKKFGIEFDQVFDLHSFNSGKKTYQNLLEIPSLWLRSLIGEDPEALQIILSDFRACGKVSVRYSENGTWDFIGSDKINYPYTLIDLTIQLQIAKKLQKNLALDLPDFIS